MVLDFIFETSFKTVSKLTLLNQVGQIFTVNLQVDLRFPFRIDTKISITLLNLESIKQNIEKCISSIYRTILLCQLCNIYMCTCVTCNENL